MSDRQRGVVPASLQDPHADKDTQPFWGAALEGRLVAPRCANCGTFRLPPGPFCFRCQHQEVDWVELPGTGTVYTFTVVRHPLRPSLGDAVPYVSGVIELDGTQGAGARLIANIVDCEPDQVRVGTRVRVVWDKISDTFSMFRFAPIDTPPRDPTPLSP